MNDRWLGVLVSTSLIGVGIFLLNRDPAKLSGKGAGPTELRQAGYLGMILGVVMASVTVYIFLRGTR
jgi:hypothetical protein